MCSHDLRSSRRTYLLFKMPHLPPGAGIDLLSSGPMCEQESAPLQNCCETREYRYVPRFKEKNLLQEARNTVSDKACEIDCKDVRVGKKLGEGAFGLVTKGKWQGKSCVIKMLKDKACDKSSEVRYNCLLVEIGILFARRNTYPKGPSKLGGILWSMFPRRAHSNGHARIHRGPESPRSLRRGTIRLRSRKSKGSNQSIVYHFDNARKTPYGHYIELIKPQMVVSI